MKKFYYSLSIVLSLFLSSPALAKTEGFYLGLDVIHSRSKVKTQTVSIATISSYYAEMGITPDFYKINESFKNSKMGIGFNAKYAINFNNFYLAPGFSLDYLNLNPKKYSHDMGFDVNLKMSSRMAYYADFGYDINDTFSIFVPLGTNRIIYELNTIDLWNDASLKAYTKDSDSSLFYGLGVNAKVNEKFALKFEYNKTSLNLDSKTKTVQLYTDTKIRNKVNLDIFKVGAVYKF